MLENAVPLSAAIEDFNEQLATQLGEFTCSRNVTTKLVDTHVPFLEALENPQEYGAPDDTCFNEDGVSCVSETAPRTEQAWNTDMVQLWFNDYHPAVEIHRLVGAQVANDWASGFFECVDSVLCT